MRLRHILGIVKVPAVEDQRPTHHPEHAIEVRAPVRLPFCVDEQRIGARQGIVVRLDVFDAITEMVTMEDLYISEEGQAWKDVLDGFYHADGQVPAQIDGGLKCFGHPIGASGLRMLYEMYAQLLGRAGERQLKDPVFGMTHNLGGQPHQNVSSVAIVGREGA